MTKQEKYKSLLKKNGKTKQLDDDTEVLKIAYENKKAEAYSAIKAEAYSAIKAEAYSAIKGYIISEYSINEEP